MTDAISDIQSSFTTTTTDSQQALDDTRDQFLQMLTTQLQNQDPLSPMDTVEFTNQLVSFTQVEQQIGMNERLDALIALQGGGGGIAPLVDFIGMDVESLGSQFAYGGSPVDLAYSNDGSLTQGVVAITDPAGRLIRTLPMDTSAGFHRVTWDGRDSAGNEVPPGDYRIAAGGLNGADEEVESSTYVTGRVSGVETGPDGDVLVLDGGRVTLNDVTAVRAPA